MSFMFSAIKRINMNYLPLFSLFGSLFGFMVIAALYLQKQITKVSIFLCLVIAFLSLRSYRDFSAIISMETVVSNAMQVVLFYLSDFTLIIPAILAYWIKKNHLENTSFRWYELLPYGIVILSLVGVFFVNWSQRPLLYEIVYFHLQSVLLISLVIIYSFQIRSLRLVLRYDEKVVAFGFLAVTIFQVVSREFALFNVKLGLGFDPSPLFVFQIIVKSGYVFLASIILYELLGQPFFRRNKEQQKVIETEPEILDRFKEKQMFLSPEIKVEVAARMLKVPKVVLSKTLSKDGETNFNDYVNDLRIDHFIEKLKSNEHLKYSIMGLAESSGFKSKATFNRAFKKRMNVTPTEYIKTLEADLVVQNSSE